MARRLGQHWMNNPSAIGAIVDALDPGSGDVVLEVGPGKGALTLPLLEKCEKNSCHVIALERDEQLAAALQAQQKPNLTIYTGDALKLLEDVNALLPEAPTPYKLVGNIPYYITGKLLRMITQMKRPPERAILTIQREVAERLTAQPPHMNLLAAMIGHAATISILMHLKPGHFTPPPKVASSIIALHDIRPYSEKAAHYEKLVRTAFSHPRKQLINNLKRSYEESRIRDAFAQLDIPETIRPQRLSQDTLHDLAELLTENAR